MSLTAFNRARRFKNEREKHIKNVQEANETAKKNSAQSQEPAVESRIKRQHARKS